MEFCLLKIYVFDFTKSGHTLTIWFGNKGNTRMCEGGIISMSMKWRGREGRVIMKRGLGDFFVLTTTTVLIIILLIKAWISFILKFSLFDSELVNSNQSKLLSARDLPLLKIKTYPLTSKFKPSPIPLITPRPFSPFRMKKNRKTLFFVLFY